MQLTPESSSEVCSEYVIKLNQALDLVLNDLPDLQDDTLMMKCLDSVKAKLLFEKASSSTTGQTNVSQSLRKFLIEEILLNKVYRSSLVEKGTEIVQFFLELTSIYVEIFGYLDIELLIATQDFLKLYFDVYLHVQFFTDPTICCSILNLLSHLYDQAISNKNLPTEFVTFFNCILIDTYMFSCSSIQTMLEVNCKSIFVRKLYKQLLNKHLVYLIEEKLNNYSLEFERLDTLIYNLGKNLPVEIRMHNLDIISDVIVHFLEHSKAGTQVMAVRYLFEFFSKFEFSKISLECLLNTEHLINDASIEAATILIEFDLLQKLFNLNSFSGLEKNLPEVNRSPEDIILPEVNKICAHFINNKSCNENSSENYSFIVFKKSSDLLFKFLVYFRLFLNKLGRMSLITTDTIRSHIDSLIVAPLTMSFNADNKVILPNYLGLIGEKPLKWKEVILKQSLSNLKLLLRKHTFDLESFVTNEQILYILRNLLINLSTKDMLLSTMIDYYKKTEHPSGLGEICSVFVDSFKLKINNHFNVNIFKLISLNLKYVNNTESAIQLIELVKSHLSPLLAELTATSGLDQTEYFKDQFEIFLQFLKDCLDDNINNLEYVNTILNSSDYFILKICSEFLQYSAENNSSHLCNVMGLEYIQNTIYELFQILFSRLNEAAFSEINYITAVFDSKFINNVEKLSLTETEALVRRPSVKFLGKYYIYKIETNLQSDNRGFSFGSYLNIFNHFAHLLMSEFDWQVQIYCLDFFQDLWNIIFKHLDGCGYKAFLSSLEKNKFISSESTFIESLCIRSDFFKSILNSLNDYDSSVVNLSAKIVSNLSKNQSFITILEALIEKDEEFWSNYYASFNSNSVDLEISDKSVSIKDFSNLIKTARVEKLIETSKNTTDLYTMNPLAVLDDLINSYQFHLEDETHIDCY